MSDPLDGAIAALGRTPGLDLIVHLGSGPDTSLATEKTTGARRILRLDPDPDAARVLARQAAEDRVTVEPAAVAPVAGHRALYRMSLPMLSGLYPGDGFQPLFPGVTCLSQPEVDVLDGTGLLALAGLDATGETGDSAPEAEAAARRLLICSAVQASADLVAALGPEGLAHFGHLLLQLPRQAWHAGAAAAETVLATLREAGFHVQDHWDDDPDFPLYRLQHVTRGLSPEAQARTRALEQDLGATQEKLRAAEEARERAEGEVARLNQRLDMSLHLQTLRETDLAELRRRYGALQDESAARDRLMDRLIDELDRVKAAHARAKARTPARTAPRTTVKAAAGAQARTTAPAQAEAEDTSPTKSETQAPDEGQDITTIRPDPAADWDARTRAQIENAAKVGIRDKAKKPRKKAARKAAKARHD